MTPTHVPHCNARCVGDSHWLGVSPAPTTRTPEALEAIFDQIADLVIEWHEADRYADNCPRSEQDEARERAEERKDTVMQFLAQMLPAIETPLGGHAPDVFPRGCDAGSEREAATVPPRGSMDDIRLNGSESTRALAIAREAYVGVWDDLPFVEQRALIAAALKAARNGGAS